MRKFDYARTSPRALGGFVVFVVVFAVDIMARLMLDGFAAVNGYTC